MAIVHYVLNYGKERYNTEDTYPQYFIEELKPSTTYTIQIQARNKMGVGDYETITVTTKEYCEYTNNHYVYDMFLIEAAAPFQ